jgi:DNA-binding GntR family transcriptional regulator
MPVDIEKLQGSVLRHRVLDAIEDSLVSGALRPGDHIVESDIARKAGISRGPVREAIQQLVGEGILVDYPHRGTYVASWTKTDVAEAYGLRALLENEAAQLAAVRMTGQQKAELTSIVDLMEARAKAGDVAGVSELDRRFHHCIYENSGHALLARMLGSLWRRISMMVSFDAKTSPDLVKYVENHRMQLEALRKGEPDEIERVFREHFVTTGEALIRRMDGSTGSSDKDEPHGDEVSAPALPIDISQRLL